MKKGTVEIDDTRYLAVKAEPGKCCVVCDLGQTRCSFDCQQFEEDKNDYVALRAINN